MSSGTRFRAAARTRGATPSVTWPGRGEAPVLALIDSPAHLGYLALAALIGAESAGVPLPGETALIAAAVLAHAGELRIELVIPIAAAAAIVGDNIGYLIGRRGARALLLLPGPFRSRREAFPFVRICHTAARG